VPTTLIGVAILVALLGPGFCYEAARERRFPSRNESVFRETVHIAAASVILNGLVLLVFWTARAIWPHQTVNVGKLIAHPHAYWVASYHLILGWSIGLLIAACIMGLIAGHFFPEGKGTLYASSWWRLFQIYPDAEKYVGCQLVDGSYISGQLYSYNMEAQEIPDRDLVLMNAKYRSPKGKDLVKLGATLTAVSARQIQFLSVTYRSQEAPGKSKLRYRMTSAWRVLRGPAQVETPVADPPETATVTVGLVQGYRDAVGD
jgi:hypothetical protein